MSKDVGILEAVKCANLACGVVTSKEAGARSAGPDWLLCCKACRQYWNRNNAWRPADLVTEHADRRASFTTAERARNEHIESTPTLIKCGNPSCEQELLTRESVRSRPNRMTRCCRACYQYWGRHKTWRPSNLTNMPRRVCSDGGWRYIARSPEERPSRSTRSDVSSEVSKTKKEYGEGSDTETEVAEGSARRLSPAPDVRLSTSSGGRISISSLTQH